MNNRIAVALSICDKTYYFIGPFLGAWIAPKGKGYQSMGTIGTCALAAKISEYAVKICSIYNAMLAACYILMVRFNWNEDKLRIFFLPTAMLPLPQYIMYTIYGGGNYAGCTTSAELSIISISKV